MDVFQHAPPFPIKVTDEYPSFKALEMALHKARRQQFTENSFKATARVLYNSAKAHCTFVNKGIKNKTTVFSVTTKEKWF